MNWKIDKDTGERRFEVTATDGELTTIDITNDDEIRKMCKEELVLAIRANSGKPVIAQLVNALLDRIDGKPAQTINAAVDTKHHHVVQIVKFADMPYDYREKIIEHEEIRKLPRQEQ